MQFPTGMGQVPPVRNLFAVSNDFHPFTGKNVVTERNIDPACKSPQPGTRQAPACSMGRDALGDFGPLYHSYSFFGVENEQIAGIYKPNQIAKSQIISAYIAFAFAMSSQKTSGSVSFAELFCADGYYAMVARSLGCHPCHGIDNNRDNHTKIAPEIVTRLGRLYAVSSGT